jgi:multiple antibiotic resistance protein
MHKPDVAIVPLAMPLLAGPGAIATVMVLTAQATRVWQFALLALSIVVTAALSYLLLRAASLVNRFLGNTGRAILERVMGLLLVAIAVQFMLGGIRDAFPELFIRPAAVGSSPRPTPDQ